MAPTGTADNMNSAVSRLTEQRSGMRFDRVDPFAPSGESAAMHDIVDPPAMDDGFGYDDEFNPPVTAKPRTASNGKRTRRAKTRKPIKLTASGRKLRKLVAPLLMALAIGLIVPAVWSVLVLGGLDVALSDKDASRPMAMMMLVCWPLAAFMAFVAGWMIRDLMLAEPPRER